MANPCKAHKRSHFALAKGVIGAYEQQNHQRAIEDACHSEPIEPEDSAQTNEGVIEIHLVEMVLEDPAAADPEHQAADDRRGHARVVVSFGEGVLEHGEDEHDHGDRNQREESDPCDDQRQDDVEFAEPQCLENDQTKDEVFEGHHDVVINEIGDVGEELILMITEEVEFLFGCSIALDCHDEDADVGSQGEDSV